MAEGLQEWMEQPVSLITNDGRHILGNLRGYDQSTNLILEDSVERIYSEGEPLEQVPLGLYIIRGDNIAMIAETDPIKDAATDWENLRAEPLKPVIH